jgi:hypothetical protein
MHYGHPDVFDRIFHITRGGISKASRVINISEDIYAGSFFVLYTIKLHHECEISSCSSGKIYKSSVLSTKKRRRSCLLIITGVRMIGEVDN